MTFSVGDRVRILPHEGKNDDGTPRHDLATVADPCRLTDMILVTGQPVGHYVDVIRDALPASGKQGYHESSLQRIP